MVSLRKQSFKFWEGVVPVAMRQKKDVAFINASNSEHDDRHLHRVLGKRNGGHLVLILGVSFIFIQFKTVRNGAALASPRCSRSHVNSDGSSTSSINS